MEKSANNLVIIDADSIVYVVGYDLSNMLLEPLGIIKLDEFIQDILITTGSKEYLGYYGSYGGRNFRKDIAITKEYKGNRTKEKEDWYQFWEPILKARMRDYWGFQPCLNIEADDACAIAANTYRDKYNKVTIASPDKDLFQIRDTWFYSYTSRTTVFCNETVSLHKLCAQLITGDSTDNIPGCIGAGPAAAKDVIAEIAEAGHKFDDAIKKIKDFYIEWNTKILKDKLIKKQEAEYLVKYKKDNKISKLTANVKSDALKKFIPNTSSIMSKEQAIILFKEQYALIKLVDTEEWGKKHDFVMEPVIMDNKINWDEIEIFQEELNVLADEQEFEFEDDL